MKSLFKKLSLAIAVVLALNVYPSLLVNADPGSNIAYNKPVSTSPTIGYGSYPASYLTDGRLTNNITAECAIISWDTNGLGWYEIDLGAQQQINQIMLYMSAGELNKAPRDYAIDVAADNGWVRVVQRHNVTHNASNTIQTYKFASVEGSKIRIIGSNRRNEVVASPNFRLVELEAYYDSGISESDYTALDNVDNSQYAIPMNIAFNKPVSTSPTTPYYTTTFPASRLTDGATNAAAGITWDAATGLGWYQIALGAKQQINQIVLRLPGSEPLKLPKDYAIDVATDNGWVRVAQRHNVTHNASNTIQTYKFASVEGSKIRITGSNKRTNPVSDNFRLVELEAYYDPGISESDYTALDNVDNSQYAIPMNIALERPVSTSPTTAYYTTNYPASRLTDGAVVDSAIITWDAATGLGWYQIDFGAKQQINQIVLRLSSAEQNKLPKDYAIDVFTDNGWVRVVQQHNVNYTTSDFIKIFKFASVEGSKIRITGSNKRTDPVSDNFRLVELEAYYDSGISESDYTALSELDNENYRIPIDMSYDQVFKATHAEILAKNIITLDDYAVLRAALNDFDELSNDTKALLADEKAKLDLSLETFYELLYEHIEGILLKRIPANEANALGDFAGGGTIDIIDLLTLKAQMQK